MRSRKASASPAGLGYRRFACAFALALILGVCAAAQQPAPRKPAPRMTTEDVMQPVASTADEAKEAKAAAEAGKPDAAKGEKRAVTPDEAAWRERVSQARDKAKGLERAADEAELRVTSLRNELGVSGRGAQYRNQIAADLEATGEKVKALRKQARDANADLQDLLAYGKERGYSEAEGPKPTTDDGKANEEFYRSKLAALNEEIETAERRVQLYSDRVRDIQQRIVGSSSGAGKGGIDNFTLAQLKKDKEEAQRSLDDAQAAKDRAIEKRSALIEEARRAGVSPDIFR